MISTDSVSIAAVDAAVSLPCASTVIVAGLYVPAVTAVLASETVGIGPVLFATVIPVPADTAVISPTSLAIH